MSHLTLKMPHLNKYYCFQINIFILRCFHQPCSLSTSVISMYSETPFDDDRYHLVNCHDTGLPNTLLRLPYHWASTCLGSDPQFTVHFRISSSIKMHAHTIVLFCKVVICFC